MGMQQIRAGKNDALVLRNTPVRVQREFAVSRNVRLWQSTEVAKVQVERQCRREIHGGAQRCGRDGAIPGLHDPQQLAAARAEAERLAGGAVGTGWPLSVDTHKVLVIDDNRDAADWLTMFLQLVGYEVATACAGDTLLAIGAREQPAVVLLDIAMPGQSGYETARQIRLLTRGKRATLNSVTGLGKAGRQRASPSLRLRPLSDEASRPAGRRRVARHTV